MPSEAQMQVVKLIRAAQRYERCKLRSDEALRAERAFRGYQPSLAAEAGRRIRQSLRAQTALSRRYERVAALLRD